jgi:acylphosphatase
MSHDHTVQRFVVTGRVQGIGFRLFIAREASRLKLAGWVRNRAANQVEFVVMGESVAISELAAVAQRGPASARVDDIYSEESDAAALALCNENGRGMVVAPSI